MATNTSLKQQMQNAPAKTNPNEYGLKALLKSDTIKHKFEEVLKDRSQGFTASVLSLVNNDSYLSQSEPMSIITGAMTAATLDLPLDKNLGYAYLVPFKDKNKGYIQVAQFVLGYKGYIQLAQRSGQYKALNVIEVYEGELKSWNKLTEEIEFDPEGKVSDKVIGYVGYFKLVNGFEKTTYWTRDEIESHRIRNNKGKDAKALSGVWRSDYDAMAKKTVLRNLLSKWGILSIQMQTAQITDESVQEIDTNTGEIKFADPVEDDEQDDSTDIEVNEDGEIIEPNPSKTENAEKDQTELFKGLGD